MSFILASSSLIRQQLLRNTNIVFTTGKPLVDETPVQQHYSNDPKQAALKLAKLKAAAIQKNDVLILGADQTLEFEGKLINKPADKTDLKNRLTMMAGKVHYLQGGYAIYYNGECVWSHTVSSKLVMHHLSSKDIERYLNKISNSVLNSVGGYHLEGIGLQLFETLEGDFMAMQGLAVLPVLNFLRTQEYCDVEGLL